MPDQAVAQFFTWGSLATLAGATGATFVVTNTLRTAFDFAPKWIGLVIAQFVCIATAYYAGKVGSDYVIAILNGCLVFLSAAGASSAGAVIANPRPIDATSKGGNVLAQQPLPKDSRFFASWF